MGPWFNLEGFNGQHERRIADTQHTKGESILFAGSIAGGNPLIKTKVNPQEVAPQGNLVFQSPLQKGLCLFLDVSFVLQVMYVTGRIFLIIFHFCDIISQPIW